MFEVLFVKVLAGLSKFKLVKFFRVYTNRKSLYIGILLQNSPTAKFSLFSILKAATNLPLENIK